MVVGAFPAFKLGALALRQLSKPLANVIIDRAKKSEIFRQYVCMPPAQIYNWIEVKTKMWAMNLGKPSHIPKLNEAMAIELGANLLGEFIIFSTGASLLILEYMRQTKKEQKKEEATLQEKRELRETITELELRIERQDAQLREFARTLAELSSSSSWFRLKSKKQSDEDRELNNQLKDKSFKRHMGNYNPQHGFLFKALNLIENEIF